MPVRNIAVLIAVSLLTAACVQQSGERKRISGSSSVIYADELERASHVDLLSAIASLRPNWLSRRGPTSINNEGELLVYLDRARLGGTESLRTIEISAVSRLEFLSPAQAQSRFGMGHPHGAIVVHTKT